MSRMSRLKYAIAATLLVSTLWAQTAPPPAAPVPPAPPAFQSQPPDASTPPAPTAPAVATPPPDSTVLVATKKVKPEYPSAALPEKPQGQVIVRIVVDEDGDVESAQIISGNPVLATAAVDAVKQWKFRPFIRNGQPVKAAVKLPFDFAPPADAPSADASPAAPPPAAPNDNLPEPPAPARPAPPSRIRVSSAVEQGMMLHRENPVYPSAAKQAKVQGSVILKAVISKEGTIEDLQVISGDPLLSGAAIDAVKQWRYRPYILNGDPVEVDTQIIVNFTLSER
jgi:TonB family protein